MNAEAARRLGVLDQEGLICAFRLAPVAPCGREALAAATPHPAWLHLDLTDSRARRWLEQRAGLPAAALAVLLGGEPRIHAEVGSGSLVAVLGDLHHDFDGDPESFGVLRVYVDGERMITGRLHPLRSSDTLRRQLLAGTLEVASPRGLFERYVACLADTFGSVVAELADATDDAEDLVLAGRCQEQGAALGRIRRTLARLRRALNANRMALATIAARADDASDPEHPQRLRRVAERLDAVAQDLELVQERARLLQEEIVGRIGEETNRNLYLLSIMTTTLLPITLVTGIFGMNVRGLPLHDHPHGFSWVIGLMGATVAGTLWLLRRRKVL
jgi:zinc transporter